MDRPIRVLHVDDDSDIGDLTATFLEHEHDRIAVETVSDVDEAFTHLSEHDVDCIVSDFDMPNRNGIEFLELVREDYPDLPFILFTGKGSEEVASEAISAGVTDYLQKGISSEQYELLAKRINNAVEPRRRYEQILEHLSDYVAIVDEIGEMSYISPAVERMTGFTPEEVIGTNAMKYVHPDDRATAADALSETIEQPDREVSVEYRVLTKEDEYIWIEARGGNYFDDPMIEGIMVSVRDITDRKHRETELEAQYDQLEDLTTHLEDQYRTLFEEAPLMAVVTRNDGGEPIIDDCNRRFLETLGYDKDEVIDRKLSDLYTAESAQAMWEEQAYERVLDGEFMRQDRDLLTADGEVVETILRAVPHRNEESATERTFAMYVDITERKQLRQEKERLKDFTDIVSHDLRNPLNVAEGRLELAREECAIDHLDAVSAAHDRMEVLIDDLLELAQSGKQLDELRPVDLSALSDACWQNVDTAEATIQTDVERRIVADRNRVKQLLENLFRNAIEHGGANVTVTVGELDDGFFVEDDGSGIPESARNDVFETGYSTSEAGTGFGLSIVHRIVEAHGWTVDMTDGARFEITGVEFVE